MARAFQRRDALSSCKSTLMDPRYEELLRVACIVLIAGIVMLSCELTFKTVFYLIKEANAGG
jgi:hypothetical protein